MKLINCFIPFRDKNQVEQSVDTLRASGRINRIFLLCDNYPAEAPEGCTLLFVKSLFSEETIRRIALLSTMEYTLLYTKFTPVELGTFALERMIQVADDCQAGMVYADHYQRIGETLKKCPAIDYQPGSLRDDFDFGALFLFRSDLLKKAAAEEEKKYVYAGLYQLRLYVSRMAALVHINEFLYTEVEQDIRKSGEKQFDYVDPKNRSVQLEMEAACTEHLQAIGAFLRPVPAEMDFSQEYFPAEVSVIIPVKDRVRTLEDAIRSVLEQQTDFKFNLIIIDNHSTDGTAEIIKKYISDERVIHLIPARTDLGIGGCWNEGVFHPACGKFAVQLDSDDLYKGTDALQKIVNVFYEQHCAMVIGTYQMTDFNLRPIPPGIIDHREWTLENGLNNALRINGLGAPRAFYTPLVRKYPFPNTSYGEDYAMGLRISRNYRIGRLYEVVYLCRRWENNSDAALDIGTINTYNFYKDRLRSWEIQARIKMNAYEGLLSAD